MHEMHVSLPETVEFLKADLSRDPSDALMRAESRVITQLNTERTA
jgi:acetolactate decarboxylase